MTTLDKELLFIAGKLSALLPQRLMGRKEMVSPPTITINASSQIASARLVRMVSNSAAVAPTAGSTSLSGGGAWAGVNQSGYIPSIKAQSVDYGGGGGKQANFQKFSVDWYGTALEFVTTENNQYYMIKVDGEYVSLMPAQLLNTGAPVYVTITFGSAASRCIEVLTSYAPVQGWNIEPTAVLRPARLNGPRVIVPGASFVEGGSSNYVAGFVPMLADVLRWDDVWASGVGATGYITAPGGKYPLGANQANSRLTSDVIAHIPTDVPSICIFSGDLAMNDGAQTYAALYAESVATYQAVKAVRPKCIVFAEMPTWPKGPGYMPAGNITARSAIRDAAAAAGVYLLDLVSQPLPNGFSFSTTLTSSVSANATSISTVAALTVGECYAFADGSIFECKASSGSGPATVTVDNIANAQASGAAVTLVGRSLITGNGKSGATNSSGTADILVSSDGTHPTILGASARAMGVAYQVANILRALTR